MATVFVSYSRKSERAAKNVAEDIESLGHSVWFDQDLSGGQVWWDQILATIRDCDVFVFVLDPESLNSTACVREFGYAADLGKPILPILVSEGVSPNLLPPALSQIQFVDYRKEDRAAAFQLARALTAVPAPRPLPDPLPSPPEVPMSYLGGLTEQVKTTRNLSYEEQSALVVDLKRSLRDQESAADAHSLLETLRKRRDLFAAIAEEIDELLTTDEPLTTDELLTTDEPPAPFSPAEPTRKTGDLPARVRATIADQLGIEESSISNDMSILGDLEADELDFIEIIMELEEQFDVTIPDEVAEKIVTVGDAVDLLTELTGV